MGNVVALLIFVVLAALMFWWRLAQKKSWIASRMSSRRMSEALVSHQLTTPLRIANAVPKPRSCSYLMRERFLYSEWARA